MGRKEVEKALQEASEKIKQRKAQTLENLKEARDAAVKFTAIQEEADRIAGDFVLDELLEDVLVGAIDLDEIMAASAGKQKGVRPEHLSRVWKIDL